MKLVFGFFLKAIVGWVGDETIHHPCQEFLKFVLFSMGNNVQSFRILNEFTNMFVPVTKLRKPACSLQEHSYSVSLVHAAVL